MTQCVMHLVLDICTVSYAQACTQISRADIYKGLSSNNCICPTADPGGGGIAGRRTGRLSFTGNLRKECITRYSPKGAKKGSHEENLTINLACIQIQIDTDFG